MCSHYSLYVCQFKDCFLWMSAWVWSRICCQQSQESERFAWVRFSRSESRVEKECANHWRRCNFFGRKHEHSHFAWIQVANQHFKAFRFGAKDWAKATDSFNGVNRRIRNSNKVIAVGIPGVRGVRDSIRADIQVLKWSIWWWDFGMAWQNLVLNK